LTGPAAIPISSLLHREQEASPSALELVHGGRPRQGIDKADGIIDRASKCGLIVEAEPRVAGKIE
jgi:hypothetical protein